MRRVALGASVLGVAIAIPLGFACGTLESSTPAPPDASEGAATTPPPVPPGTDAAGCDLAAPFTSVEDILELDDAAAGFFSISTPRLTQDERRIFFEVNAGGASYDIWTAERASLTDSFTNAHRVEDLRDPDASASHPGISADGSEIFFTRISSGADAGRVAIEEARGDGGGFGAAAPVAKLDTAGNNSEPFLLDSPRQVWFVSDRESANVTHIFRASDPGAGFGDPVVFDAGLDAGQSLYFPTLSADGRALYFAVFGRNAQGGNDTRVYRAVRPSVNESFGGAQEVTELMQRAPSTSQLPGWISPDHCRLYMSIETSANRVYKLAVASR
jgi:hypothetical protein